MAYSTIAIIYNPNSTGSSDDMANTFADKLRSQMPHQAIELYATKHAGHAEEMAYKVASATDNALIISSSGDGGYNEVVNGALKAQREGHKVTTGLIPAGNANDHYRNMHSTDLVERIVTYDDRVIDVLCVKTTVNGKPFERVAHSYAGVGITPKIGKKLNKTKLNRFNETWLVLRTLFTAKPVRLRINSKTKYYESIIFSNIDGMSKYMQVSQPSRVNDGVFEVTLFPRSRRLQLIYLLFKASFVGLKEDLQVENFVFNTIDKTLIQVDGEVITIDAGVMVEVCCMKRALTCIV